MMPTWAEPGRKFDFFVQKSWSFCNSKHCRQNIMTLCYSCYFCVSSILIFFQITMVSFFLTRHDQYFIMFKDSNVFDITNFPFKSKCNNTVAYSANSNYLFSRKKREKKCWNNSLIKSTVYLLIFRQNLINFEGSPNSLTVSGEVLIHFCFDRKYSFLENLVKKNQIGLSWNLATKTKFEYAELYGGVHFFFLRLKTLFLDKFVTKSQNCHFKLKLVSRLIRICRI